MHGPAAALYGPSAQMENAVVAEWFARIAALFQSAVDQHSAWVYVWAFAGGLADCLTPCSALATPVAVSYFAANQRLGIDRRRALVLAAVFFATLAASYMAIGLIAAVVGTALFQFIGESPLPPLAVGGLLGYLLFVLLITEHATPDSPWLRLVPSFLRQTTLADLGGRRGTVWGAAATGAAVATMMGPCAAPVLTLILAVVASAKNPLFGASLLFAFSLGIGTFMLGVGFSGGAASGVLARVGPLRRFVGLAVEGMVAVVAVVLLGIGVMRFFPAADCVAPPPVPAPTAPVEPCVVEAPIHRSPALADGQAPVALADLKPGVALPRFIYTTPEGRVLAADERAGKYLFITYWASWCSACLQEVPAIRTMIESQRAAGHLDVLAVNVGDTEAVMRTTMVKHGINYPVLHDPDETMLEALGITSIPLNLLVGPDGRIVYIGGDFPHEYAKLIGP